MTPNPTQRQRTPIAAAVAGALFALLAAQSPTLDARERGAAAQRPARAMAQRPSRRARRSHARPRPSAPTMATSATRR
jgi:hypothetical protein